MSAFVVSQSCMDQVVRTLCARNIYGFSLFREIAGVNIGARKGATQQQATQIGRRLYNLNIEAVMQRYPDCEDATQNIPGAESVLVPARYIYTGLSVASKLSRADLCAGLKALECLFYQCSGGAITRDTVSLYAEIKRAIGTVACEIVRALPEYQSAQWGE